jgi:hypothetical protein
MSDLPARKEDLEKYKKEARIIGETARQVMKDFAQFGMEVTFSGNTNMAYEELFDQLVLYISKLLSSQPERLRALLYQIDIGETDIARYAPSDKEFTTEQHLSELILIRELKKVVTRDYFRQKPGKL